MMLLCLRVDYVAIQNIGETWQWGKESLLFFALYALPGLLVGFGAYSHGCKTQPWGRLLLIAASLFITLLFFLSLAMVVWTGLFLPAVAFTSFAIITSAVSLVVRRET